LLPTVHHAVDIDRPPSAVFNALRKANSIKDWAPTVTSSTCSEQLVSEGTSFSVKADLKPVGGPKFEFDNVIAKLAENKELVWRQTKGSMKKLEWHFVIEPVSKNGDSQGASRLFLAIDYEMPYSVFGAIMDKVKMYKVITGACKVNLEGLKGKLEST
jgi:uncharacterized membrane protein